MQNVNIRPRDHVLSLSKSGIHIGIHVYVQETMSEKTNNPEACWDYR